MCNQYLKLPFPISLECVPYLWQQSDILIFLLDLENYDAFNTSYLSRIELKSLEKLQTDYFKKRYIISRTVLKHIVCNASNEQSAFEISTYKDKHGKVCIRNHNELHICISYTENIVALAISKVAVGIDIELARKLALRSTLKNLYTKPLIMDENASKTDLLRIWTLKEAYSKFSNKNMHLIFSKELDLSRVSHSTYVLDNKYVLSVITDSSLHNININRLQKIDWDWD